VQRHAPPTGGLPQTGFDHPAPQGLFRDAQSFGGQMLGRQCRTEIGVALRQTCHDAFLERRRQPPPRGLAAPTIHQTGRALRFVAPQQAPHLPIRQPQAFGGRFLAHHPVEHLAQHLQPLELFVTHLDPLHQNLRIASMRTFSSCPERTLLFCSYITVQAMLSTNRTVRFRST